MVADTTVVKIVEVGPRDGLQNEKTSFTLEQKKTFIELLVQAGHRHIEVGAFVNPKKVPQMADTKALVQMLKVPKQVQLSALVPNQRGFQDALEVRLKHIALFTAASDSFNKKNVGVSIEECLQSFSVLTQHVKANGMSLRAYVSCAFGCPFEGIVPQMKVVEVSERLVKLGVDEISISDTIGVATPEQVETLMSLLATKIPLAKIALHFHDTHGRALENVVAGFKQGVRVFDASSGGLGGCPFAPGAAGNLATEDLVDRLQDMSCTTGIDLQAQIEASRFVEEILHRRLPSSYLQDH